MWSLAFRTLGLGLMVWGLGLAGCLADEGEVEKRM